MLLTLNHTADSCALLLQILSPQQPKQRAIHRQKRGFLHTLLRAAVYSPPRFIFPHLCFTVSSGTNLFPNLSAPSECDFTEFSWSWIILCWNNHRGQLRVSLKYSDSVTLHLAVSPARVFAPGLSISRSRQNLFLSLVFRSQGHRVLFRRAAELVQDVSNWVRKNP